MSFPILRQMAEEKKAAGVKNMQISPAFILIILDELDQKTAELEEMKLERSPVQ